jgi:hypothetical protein
MEALMANLILPNGQTIQTDNPADIAEFMSRGAQTQESALASYAQTAQVGSAPTTIQQIASERGQEWNSQGGQGYLEAMRQGHNDPTSNPSNPQAFSQAAIQQYNGGAGNGLLTNPTGSGGGGLLGGGGGGGGNNAGGGFNSQMPSPTVPMFSNVGNIAGQQGQMPGQMPAPTIGAFNQPQGQQQSFEDILGKYNLYATPLQNGTGFNWMTPSVTPGAVNVMDANYSRRNL